MTEKTFSQKINCCPVRLVDFFLQPENMNEVLPHIMPKFGKITYNAVLDEEAGHIIADSQASIMGHVSTQKLKFTWNDARDVIYMDMTEGPLKKLSAKWSFNKAADNVTNMVYELEYDVSNVLSKVPRFLRGITETKIHSTLEAETEKSLQRMATFLQHRLQ